MKRILAVKELRFLFRIATISLFLILISQLFDDIEIFRKTYCCMLGFIAGCIVAILALDKAR